MLAAQQTAAVTVQPEFEQLVQQLISPSNELRQQAEARLTSLKEQNPQYVVTQLLLLLRTSVQLDHRTFAAVLLRKVCTWCTSSAHFQRAFHGAS